MSVDVTDIGLFNLAMPWKMVLKVKLVDLSSTLQVYCTVQCTVLNCIVCYGLET